MNSTTTEFLVHACNFVLKVLDRQEPRALAKIGVKITTQNCHFFKISVYSPAFLHNVHTYTTTVYFSYPVIKRDKNLVVGIVLVEFRKAFDSISHHVLLNKFQAVGVPGDLWYWIKDYLADRSQATVVTSFQSETLPVKFGVPQGSVLGTTLFSLFCNDLPHIV